MSSRKRGSEKVKTTTDFCITVYDETENHPLKTEKVRKTVLKSSRRKFFIVAKPGHEFSVQVCIGAEAWGKYNEGYDWIHCQLLIDGEPWASYGIEKPYDYEIRRGVSKSHTFRFARDSMRPFIFASRHEPDASDQPTVKSEVGYIVVKFRSGRSRSRQRMIGASTNMRRRSRDYSHLLAKQIRMDTLEKERNSTCRMTLGENRGETRPTSGRRPYDIVNEHDSADFLCSCTVMYDTAENLKLKAWLDPYRHKRDRQYFPEVDWKEEVRRVRENRIVDVCDLTGDSENWSKTTEAKRQIAKEVSRSEISSSVPIPRHRTVSIDLREGNSKESNSRPNTPTSTTITHATSLGDWKNVIE